MPAPVDRPHAPVAPSRADHRAGRPSGDDRHPTRERGPSDRASREAPGDAPEPRWTALLAVLAVGLLHLALPDALTLGPPWLLLITVSVLLVPTVVAHRMGRSTLNQVFGYAVLGVMTVALLASLAQLVLALPTKAEPPSLLLRSAAALWLSNILVFASWYWRLDAGGPHARARSNPRDAGWRGAFLFPQQTLGGDDGGGAHAARWRPTFVDYLFIAFNTSTAFSPTDAPVLSRWAKVLMMIQSFISLATIALLAGRAINIL